MDSENQRPSEKPRPLLTGTRRAVGLRKASILIEALPWLSRFHGETVVICFGGSAMVDPELRRTFAEDVMFLRYSGIRTVVVHGDVPVVDEPADNDAHHERMRLVGIVNRDVAGLINTQGPFAVGLSGEDVGLSAAIRSPNLRDGSTLASVLPVLLDSGKVPVVISVWRSDDGNGRVVEPIVSASAIAASLSASKLVVLDDLDGLPRDPPTEGDMPRDLTASDLMRPAHALPPSAAVWQGPSLEALQGGVRQVHLLDGRVPHALLTEVFTDNGCGVLITRE